MNTTTSASAELAWHSVSEAAALTGASVRTIWRRINASTIPNRMTADGRRLVGISAADLTSTTADLTAAAGAAAGALRAADGLSDAIKVLEAQAAQVLARADQRAEEAVAAARRAEGALRRWRLAAVILPAVMALSAMYLRGPASSSASSTPSPADDTAAGQSSEVASGAPDKGVSTYWHPPMASP